MTLKTIVLGGGDLASGVALRLYHAGCQVLLTELPQPYAVRRSVSFAQAVFDGQITIEDVPCRSFPNFSSIQEAPPWKFIPIVVDPTSSTIEEFQPDVIVDARMTKKRNHNSFYPQIFTIGMGPGFMVGENCHAVVETKRGHTLGRVYFSGSAADDTGIPERVANFQKERVLRAPASGIFHTSAKIGQVFQEQEEIAQVEGEIVRAPFYGMLRGLLHDGLRVTTGLKVGDLDPRTDPKLYQLVSDKALAISGGVLEAILSQAGLRKRLSE